MSEAFEAARRIIRQAFRDFYGPRDRWPEKIEQRFRVRMREVNDAERREIRRLFT